MTDISTSIRTAAQQTWTAILWAAKKAHNGAVYLFAPVATSVKGALDKTDMRPIITKIVVIASAAGASFSKVSSEALKDPELAGAAVVLSVAVITGFLEALTRHQAERATTPVPPATQPPAPSPTPAPPATTPPTNPTGPAS